MVSEAQSRALEVCLQNLLSGMKVEQVVGLYPQWEELLTPPLEAAQTLQVYRETLQSPVLREDQERAAFLQAARELQSTTRPPFRQNRPAARLFWLAFSFLVLAGVLWGYVLTSVALPGNLLYPLKTLAWQAVRALPASPTEQLARERAYDQARLDEVQELLALGRQARVEFSGLYQADSTGQAEISGLQLVFTPQTEIIGQVRNGIWVEASGTLQADGLLQAEQIRPREYFFQGQLEQLSPDQLVIAGIAVQFGQESLVHGWYTAHQWRAARCR
ncbi:MAG: DUF5666 domain-containing protein [Anaerolineales bacterium]|nr:DUF5666 domain-containing protein [Anaerolineales bacterium]